MGRRVDALVRRLVARLLNRSTRLLALANGGIVYLEYCRKLLAGIARADNLIFERHQTATGHLSASGRAAFCREHIALDGPSFVGSHPDFRVSLKLDDQFVNLVRLSHGRAHRPRDGPGSRPRSTRREAARRRNSKSGAFAPAR